MEMPRPTEKHNALNAIIGDWVGVEKINPSPFDPVGGEAVGRIQNRSALDGFAVIQDYEQERNGIVTFRGHGVFRWDPVANEYLLHWYDSFGSAPSDFHGTMANGALELVSTQAQGSTRAVFDFSQPDTYTYRMEVSPDGSQWFVFMEGEYQRKDPPTW